MNLYIVIRDINVRVQTYTISGKAILYMWWNFRMPNMTITIDIRGKCYIVFHWCAFYTRIYGNICFLLKGCSRLNSDDIDRVFNLYDVVSILVKLNKAIFQQYVLSSIHYKCTPVYIYKLCACMCILSGPLQTLYLIVASFCCAYTIC